eukprot:Gregarina_sp_Poly_1__4833@NODE_2575_length_1962_cov_288_174142_g1634_i0_p1_GENE_NODE_2575_length_1962_cov_288_174142_g1634_i0NODE_2575_length_1962_cov_288_174142_g1634_i0_p1_ORF_typecomplete_len580_score83_27VHS/PF00790_19/1_1e18VHS/PF00790_19/5_5e02Dimer_Tnp_hAT/PF05699_14/0_24ENTH/PF01417_20/0_3Telomere_reg2/PF10193_9/3_9e02Telomere_reg2/PF10193_9/2_5_NODE_2575_length_1962_cov_288_174142_g1634_i01711910
MASPSEQPDSFCAAYDPPMAPTRTSNEGPTTVPGPASSSMQMTRGRSQPIPYAPPGSTSSSINPASTVAFMLNMGYPPPPIALEPLRRLLEQMTQGPGQVLNLQLAIHVTDEVSRSPYRIAPAVLFVLQQRLHSSKPDRVTLALELLDMCVKNCGLDFVRHINKEFMKSMVSVIKTTSFKERTITGQMKKLEKYLIGSPSSGGVATDPRVHKLKRQCLSMIQNWADAFMMHPSSVQPILETYKSLRRKGVQFPPRDTAQKYLVKHAEDSPAFDGCSEGVTASAGGVVDNNMAPSLLLRVDDAEFADESFETAGIGSENSMDCPFSERQFSQLEKLINLLRTSDDPETVDKALEMCERLRPKLEESLRILTTRINSGQSKKLRGSDPRVAQLNAILDLDSEVKKRKGTRLIYTGGNKQGSVSGLSPSKGQVSFLPAIEPLSTRSPLAEEGNTESPAVPTPPAPIKPSVNLLDDLLDAPELVPAPANVGTTAGTTETETVITGTTEAETVTGINAVTTHVECPAQPAQTALPTSLPRKSVDDSITDFWSTGVIDFTNAATPDPFASIEATSIEDFFVRPSS